MQKVSFASPDATDAPLVTVVDQLRPPNLDVARITPRTGLGTSPTKPLGPKPAPPVQRLTARPLPRDVHIPSAPYGPISVTRAELDQQMADEGLAPVGIGEPHAWKAFRDELTGGDR